MTARNKGRTTIGQLQPTSNQTVFDAKKGVVFIPKVPGDVTPRNKPSIIDITIPGASPLSKWNAISPREEYDGPKRSFWET